MRISIKLNDVNQFGIKIVGGPYPGGGRGNQTNWDFLCKHCGEIFLAPTTRFRTVRSCYKCRGILMRKSSEEITWKNHYGMVKGRQHSKEKGFDLTLEQFIELSKQDCFYCGSKPTPTKGHRKWSTYINTNGLDRVDSSMGYFYSNVVPCCIYCNMAKRERTQEEFYNWIKNLIEYQLKK